MNAPTEQPPRYLSRSGVLAAQIKKKIKMNQEQLLKGLKISKEIELIDNHIKQLKDLLNDEGTIVNWIKLDQSYFLQPSHFSCEDKLNESILEFTEKLIRVLEKSKSKLEKEFENL